MGGRVQQLKAGRRGEALPMRPVPAFLLERSMLARRQKCAFERDLPESDASTQFQRIGARPPPPPAGSAQKLGRARGRALRPAPAAGPGLCRAGSLAGAF